MDLTLGGNQYAQQITGYLKKGSKGAQVKAIQSVLVDAGFSVGAAGVDGDFGNGTDAAVRKFQSARSLVVDGVVGPETARLMGFTWAQGTSSTGGGDSDVYDPETSPTTAPMTNWSTYAVWGGVGLVAFLIAKKKGWLKKVGIR